MNLRPNDPHLAFKVDDLDAMIETLTENDVDWWNSQFARGRAPDLLLRPVGQHARTHPLLGRLSAAVQPEAGAEPSRSAPGGALMDT